MAAVAASEILSPFTLAIFRLYVEAVDPLYLPPYKGSAIRGSFGHTFRSLACVNGIADCAGCLLSDKCVYAYTFETRAPEGGQFLRNRRDQLPHPYVIRPPLDTSLGYAPGESFQFELVLAGKAIEYLPYFAMTFINMGNVGLGRGKGRFILKQIDNIHLNGKGDTVYSEEQHSLTGALKPIHMSEILEGADAPRQFTLRFLTRLELKEKGGHPSVSFGRLFRRLLARITTMAYLHCGIDCSKLDFSGLSRRSDDVRTVSSNLRWESSVRYSNRQGRRMPFSGLLGQVTFAGDLSPFWPFLLLGEMVHVGKKTTFGFGRYELLRGRG